MSASRTATAVLCGVQIVDVMGVTVVVSALPRMLSDLGASPAAAGLLVPGYAVGFAALLVVAARWGDRRGHRWVLLGGLVTFAVASVLAAVAPTTAVLVAARFLQGVAAAVSVPNALALLTREAGPDRGRALSAWNACGGLAGAAGLLVGGLVTDAVGWRAIFWANIAVTVLLAAGVLRTVRRDCAGGRAQESFDTRSACLQVATIALVVAAADAARHSGVLLAVLGALAAGAALLLVVRERRAPSPLVPHELWRRPAFVAGLAGSFGVTATTSTFIVITTVHLQQDLGFATGSAGLMILCFSTGVVVAAAAAGRLLSAVGATAVLVGSLAVIGAGAAAAAAIPEVVGVVVVGLVLAGLGNGAGAVAAYALGTEVPDDQQAGAAGLLNTAAQVGTAVVVAVGVAVAAAVGGGATLDARSGAGVSVGAAIVVIAAVLVGRARRASRSSVPAG
ncbi:MFS transporter [Pseudonocardia sp. CA-107938]|uniref:MFS transporter n=1 Tax=Pseudonocardia sp. CA-107938 TaxID=3240021 RepID=UPI003D8E21C8